MLYKRSWTKSSIYFWQMNNWTARILEKVQKSIFRHSPVAFVSFHFLSLSLYVSKLSSLFWSRVYTTFKRCRSRYSVLHWVDKHTHKHTATHFVRIICDFVSIDQSFTIISILLFCELIIIDKKSWNDSYKLSIPSIHTC